MAFCALLQEAVERGVQETAQKDNHFWAEVERKADEMASNRDATKQQEQTT